VNDTTRRRLLAFGRYLCHGLSMVGFAFSPLGFPPRVGEREPDPVPPPGRRSTDCPEWMVARRWPRTY
jgi:hypothetical protein